MEKKSQIMGREVIKRLGYIATGSQEVHNEHVTDMYWADDTASGVAVRAKAMRGRSARTTLASLPETVRFLITSGSRDCVYLRDEHGDFRPGLLVPLADRTPWGKHSRDDLIPISGLDHMLDDASTRLKGSAAMDLIVFLLACKLFDEKIHNELTFRFAEPTAECVLPVLKMISAELNAHEVWCELHGDIAERLAEVAYIWQAFRFLPEVLGHGAFAKVGNLVLRGGASGLGQSYFLREELVTLIHALVSGHAERLVISGPTGCGLLDLALIGGLPVERIAGEFPEALRMLAAATLDDCQFVEQDFLMLPPTAHTKAIVCLPPFGGNRPLDAIQDMLPALPPEIASRNRIPEEFAWIVKAKQLLDPDGWICCLVSEGLLSNSSCLAIREWIRAHFRIMAIIGLPENALLGHIRVKTSLLLLRNVASSQQAYEFLVADLHDWKRDIPVIVGQARQVAWQDT